MSNEKFTQGEWKIKLSESLGIKKAQIFNSVGFVASSVVIPVDETRLDGESWLEMRERTKGKRLEHEQESIANIHLMAAAPEMYEMLQSLSEQDECQMFKYLINKLLAKARGEQ